MGRKHHVFGPNTPMLRDELFKQLAGKREIEVKITAILHVDDVEAAVAFYSSVLGFDTNFVARSDDGTAFHAEVLLSGAPLMLSSLQHRPSEEQRGPHGLGVIIQIDLDNEIDAYYEEVVGKGVKILDPIADRYWGQRSFLMSDLNSYTLSIAMDLPTAQ